MNAICTVGVSAIRNFTPYLSRFRRTMRDPGGFAGSLYIWSANFPAESPTHEQVHYAFKWYAMEHARKSGAQIALWLDCSCHAIRPVQPIFDKIERDGYYFIHGADRLGNWSSDHCLSEFGITRDDAMDMWLFSGTCLGIDFRNSLALDFFGLWKRYAVAEHFNGTHHSGLKPYLPLPNTEGARMSADPRCQGHRSDEPYTTMIARKLGMKSTSITADYFYGGYDDDGKGTAAIRSGYDIGGNL